MPKLLRLIGERVALVEDEYVSLADDQPSPAGADLLVSLARYQNEGEGWLTEGRRLGVRLEPDQPVEGLAYDLPRLAVVALSFPKFRDGRPYTAATLLRERFGYRSQIRAVGEVLCEQALFMVRCGFDAFEPADGSTAQVFQARAFGFRHVYQAGADARSPAFAERAGLDVQGTGRDHGV